MIGFYIFYNIKRVKKNNPKIDFDCFFILFILGSVDNDNDELQQ